MKTSPDSHVKRIIAKIIEFAQAKLSKDKAELFIKFINLYYRHMSVEDFETRSLPDLYGVIWSHWRLMQHRMPDELKIRVFNPVGENHGWESTHTIIQLVVDDMPFLVDTIRMEINRLHLTTHLTIHSGGMRVCRDKKGDLSSIYAYHSHAKGADCCTVEAPIHLEIDRQTDPEILKEIEHNLRRVLKDVRVAVEDWPKMRERMEEALTDLDSETLPQDKEEIAETRAFLEWALKDHFTLLGYRDYEIEGEGKEKALKLIPHSGLGVLRDHTHSKMVRHYADMPARARRLALSTDQILIVSKTNTMSTVHRLAYTDYIGVKRFNAKGKLIGERRFIGLYTSVAYRSDPRLIPLLRRKVFLVLKRSNLPAKSHAVKDLIHILATLPRDDLFHASVDELYDIANGISHLQERRRTRLFIRKDAFGRYFSCLVYVPRENFSTDLVSRIREILRDALHGVDITYSTRVTESVLARIHYVVRIDTKRFPFVDVKALEKKIIEVAESWQDGFKHEAQSEFGEELGNAIYSRYRYAFPAGYREVFSPKIAVTDVNHIEKLQEAHLGMSFYRPLGAAANVIRFKLYRIHETVPLSDALPMLENMGLRVIGEQPYRIVLREGKIIWINDFNMTFAKEPRYAVDDVKSIFQEAFQKIWLGQAENDSFNRLVLEAALNWREISILRAYTKYFRQIGFTFSDQYIANTLVANPTLAKLLVDLFKAKFCPTLQVDAEKDVPLIEEEIDKAMDAITSLDEDRIFTRFMDLINATVRTNFFQKDSHAKHKAQTVFKLDPSKIPDMPLPLPRYEIFVYSPRFEGVHLRMAKVARGGLRWSDRREDFRTEVLGLMKAQQVKNALIVPAGAKGGFVPKRLPTAGTRDEIMQEGVRCYQGFISGLLDITDNIVNGKIVHPENVVRLDGDDPYLVVAADTGTATFSDIANKISIARHYWMGDAFASGGSTGYDHKKMGITARGAWLSAKRHFQELGVNLAKAPITVVGIGDMSGDVFGNGLLMSSHMKLVAAFNHMHIFLDPNPKEQKSYEERKRLFEMPRSTWKDYDPKLISKGGGVYARSVKSIPLSKEVRKLLNVDKEKMVPSELIRAILKAPVDMIWNGGIGTYVKSVSETDSDVGDRANDAVRVNGQELCAKVVCEGGNLGLTQLGRIEYALTGGKINTDFIDNSGGVDCSDNEVNIKILLNPEVVAGNITLKQRDSLLARMEGSVAGHVLEDNYHQCIAISIASSVSAQHIGLYKSFIDQLAREGKLNRRLEFLPDEKTIQKRRVEGVGLTHPELAVLFAYSKNVIKEEIKHSELVNDPFLKQYVNEAFPSLLRKQFSEAMQHHYLARGIIATQLTNRLVAEMGITFVYQMQDETGASLSEIVRAYIAARKVFDLPQFYNEIESLDYKIDAKVQYSMLLDVIRLVRRATRWLLRNRKRMDISTTIDQFKENVAGILTRMPKLLLGADKDAMDKRMAELVEKKVPEAIAVKIASTMPVYHALNITEAAANHGVEVFRVAKIYFMLADRLDLLWFRDQINEYPVGDRWTVLAKAAYKCDLDWVQRALTVSVLLHTQERSIPGKVKSWLERHDEQIQRWNEIIADLHSADSKEFAILFVAIRELLDLSSNEVGEDQKGRLL